MGCSRRWINPFLNLTKSERSHSARNIQDHIGSNEITNALEGPQDRLFVKTEAFPDKIEEYGSYKAYALLMSSFRSLAEALVNSNENIFIASPFNTFCINFTDLLLKSPKNDEIWKTFNTLFSESFSEIRYFCDKL